MRGYELCNSQAADEAAAYLRNLGHEVWTPWEHDRQIGVDLSNTTFTEEQLKECFRWDFSRILQVDAVVFLPEWEKSRGCCAERVVAHYARVRCFNYHPEEEFFRLHQQPPYQEPRIQWSIDYQSE